MDAEALVAIVEREVKGYVRPSINGLMVYVSNAKKGVYGAAWLAGDPRQTSHLVVMARVVDDLVVIHADNREFPLEDELVKAGIPRQQFHVVRAGEPSLVPTEQTDADFETLD